MKAAISAALVATISLGGCAAYEDAVGAVAQLYQAQCRAIGYADGTPEQRDCVLSRMNASSSKSSQNDFLNDNYTQNRNRDLIMQHGAGGCTPNFSTGGCL